MKAARFHLATIVLALFGVVFMAGAGRSEETKTLINLKGDVVTIPGVVPDKRDRSYRA